ncbi:MAG: molybdopterin-dependent oxidoreductase [Planctomycetaceae bacterium]|nr:molybdopterin-dependent oxidoreductase [Planctomycetaceae bacterium]
MSDRPTAIAEMTCPHPFLTPSEEFSDVSRGNPKPHQLTGQALIDARMTAETWRLEITADSFTEEPHVQQPATLAKPMTIDGGNALDLNQLMDLGTTKGFGYIKAMQCLNIPTPLGQGFWEGVPLRDVLQLCGTMNNVRRIYYWGFHNNDPDQVFRSSLSYSQVMETPPGELPVFLAYRLNGQPISPLRGGPVRMVVPWAHGFKSVKWLSHIFVTNDYRTNDTYALKNNDPESPLKTAAYLDELPRKVTTGQPLDVTGLVISGWSGFSHVEYWVREVSQDSGDVDDAALAEAPWQRADLFPAPELRQLLPAGTVAQHVAGFDASTGKPHHWPLRYGMAAWGVRLSGLTPGQYEIRARAVDGNGYAQPEPRPLQKSGKNAIPVRTVDVEDA